MAGAISAGCVESDLVEWSRSVLAQGGAKLLSYDVADADAMEIGLTCGGAIDVLVESVDGDVWRPWLEAGSRRQVGGHRGGGEPGREPGRAPVFDGEVRGGIDTAVDAAVVEAMRERLAAGGSSHLVLPANGELRVFVDTVVPRARLVIVGATQTALPLVRMASELDFEVIVVDPREVYASDERMGEADQVVREWPEVYFSRFVPDDNTYVVTLTHDEKFDVPALAASLRSPARYVGALGSRRTHAKRVERLRELGLTDEDLARVHAPVGLDLGGRAPAEIALAILAEVVAEKYGKPG